MSNTSHDPQEKFGAMKSALTSQFQTVFALTAAAQPAILATMFGVDMVFRFLKFGSRLRRVYEEEHRKFDEQVRTQGVVLMPVHIRPTTTIVETFFFSGMAKSAFPDEFNDMADVMKIYREGSFMERRAAAKKLEVAYWLMNEGKNWRENETLMDLVNASIKAEENLTFRQMVDALEPLYGKEFIGFKDFDSLVEEYAMQDLQALSLNINKLQGDSISQLRSTVKEMFWDTMLFGDENTVQRTLSFLVAQKLLAQQERLKHMREKMHEEDMDDDERALMEKKMEEIEADISALEKVKSNE